MYFKATICTDVTKDPALDVKTLQEFAQIKREAGRILHSPRFSSRFACERLFRCGCYHASLQLGGQNLAATCTTTGQNLTAVCSCHSLTETVDLGTMTAAGLIGTLHVEYTSCFSLSMLDRPEDPQQHIVLDYHKSILAEYNPKMRIGQSLFSRFSKKNLTGTNVLENIYVGASRGPPPTIVKDMRKGRTERSSPWVDY